MPHTPWDCPVWEQGWRCWCRVPSLSPPVAVPYSSYTVRGERGPSAGCPLAPSGKPERCQKERDFCRCCAGTRGKENQAAVLAGKGSRSGGVRHQKGPCRRVRCRALNSLNDIMREEFSPPSALHRCRALSLILWDGPDGRWGLLLEPLHQ